MLSFDFFVHEFFFLLSLHSSAYIWYEASFILDFRMDDGVCITKPVNRKEKAATGQFLHPFCRRSLPVCRNKPNNEHFTAGIFCAKSNNDYKIDSNENNNSEQNKQAAILYNIYGSGTIQTLWLLRLPFLQAICLIFKHRKRENMSLPFLVSVSGLFNAEIKWRMPGELYVSDSYRMKSAIESSICIASIKENRSKDTLSKRDRRKKKVKRKLTFQQSTSMRIIWGGKSGAAVTATGTNKSFLFSTMKHCGNAIKIKFNCTQEIKEIKAVLCMLTGYYIKWTIKSFFSIFPRKGDKFIDFIRTMEKNRQGTLDVLMMCSWCITKNETLSVDECYICNVLIRW